MTRVSLQVTEREALGRKLRSLRRQGLLPGNIVSRNKPSRAITMSQARFLKTLELVGYTQPLDLQIGDDDKVTVLVTNVQYFPTRNLCQHVVFQAIRKGEKVTMSIPLTFVGEAPGVALGLIMIPVLDELEVEALPLQAPTEIEVDITSLKEADQTIRVMDLKLPESVESLLDPEEPLVRLEWPQVEEEPETDTPEEEDQVDDEQDADETQDQPETTDK